MINDSDELQSIFIYLNFLKNKINSNNNQQKSCLCFIDLFKLKQSKSIYSNYIDLTF
jgi:hypothetical protein